MARRRKKSYLGRIVGIRQYGDEGSFKGKVIDEFFIQDTFMLRIETSDRVVFDISFDSIASISIAKEKKAKVLAFHQKLRLVR